MSLPTKSDYVGLARTGLEVVTNEQSASNQVLEIPKSDGSYVGCHVYGSIKAPSNEYEITAAVTLKGTGADGIIFGKVYNATQPYALKSISAHSGAGEKPSFSASAVQIEEGASKTYCTYALPFDIKLSPARHAQTFGAVAEITESATLSLQSSDLSVDVDIDPTTINGVPKASDAVHGKATVTLTVWTNTDATAPAITAASGWTQTADWSCSGSDGAMFVWTATFTRYLTATAPSS